MWRLVARPIRGSDPPCLSRARSGAERLPFSIGVRATRAMTPVGTVLGMATDTPLPTLHVTITDRSGSRGGSD